MASHNYFIATLNLTDTQYATMCKIITNKKHEVIILNHVTKQHAAIRTTVYKMNIIDEYYTLKRSYTNA